MTPKQIIAAVSKITGIPYGRIACSIRIKGTGDARALAVWGILHVRPKTRQTDIADLMSQSQGSISNTVKRANERIETCPKFRKMRDQLQAVIEGQGVAA